MLMKRTGLLCGVLAVVALLALYAGAQDNPPKLPVGSAPPAADLPPLPGGPPAVDARTPAPATPPPTLREQLKAETIDSLLGKLKALKAQQAELARVERETVAVLKEKLQEQMQQLRQLGVGVEEAAPQLVPEPTRPDTKK
jgi:hypothetical protein